MSFLSNIGLQRRIIVFVIVGLIVIFALFGFFISKVFQQSIELVFEERLVLAQNIAATVDNAITYSIGEMEKMSSLTSSALKKRISEAGKGTTRDDTVGGCLTMCHDRATVKVSRVSIADEKGKLLSLEPHTSEAGSSNFIMEQIIQKALLKGETIAEAFNPGENIPAVVAISTPLKGDTGMLAGTLNLEFNPFFNISSFNSVIKSAGISYNLEIVNDRGIIMFNPERESSVGLLTEHFPLISPLMAQKKAMIAQHITKESEHGGHIIAMAPLKTIPAYVILEQERDIAFTLPASLRRRLLSSGGIVLFILTSAAIIFAWITTKRVAKPILSLASASQRIASGDLDHQIRPIGEDEVGLLARNLEDMRVKLKASREEIETWNKELEQRVQDRAKRLYALYEASQTLASTLELRTVLESIISTSKKIFTQADAGILYIAEEDLKSLAVKSYFGFNSNISSQIMRKLEEDCSGRAYLSREAKLSRPVKLSPELYHNLQEENIIYARRISKDEFEVEEALCVPLISEKRTLGVIALYNLHHYPQFSQSDVELLQSLANQAAIAIENARLFKEASMVGTLRELDRMKTEFVARASHELRTPLTSIKSFAETLLRPDLSLSSSDQKEFLEDINRAADRLARIITDLLTVSKIESGKLEVKKVITTLPPIINKVIEEFRIQARDRVIYTQVSPSLPLVWADPDRLEDILDNLLSNAIKYSPPDKPIRIYAELKKGEELLQLNNQNKEAGRDYNSYVVLSVTDEGVGISSENLNKLFQRFGRVEGETSRVANVAGVGLGLYICKVYVEAMGGAIWVNSIPGKGSTFSFSLIAAEREAKDKITFYIPEKTAITSIETSRGKYAEGKTIRKERILVVDDEADVLKTVQLNLKAHGFDILTAISGEECLNTVKKEKIDLIILDIIMPGINGLEVARQLQANPTTSAVPIIFLTAKAQEEEEIEGLQIGAAGYIKKPFSVTHLYETIVSVLNSVR